MSDTRLQRRLDRSPAAAALVADWPEAAPPEAVATVAALAQSEEIGGIDARLPVQRLTILLAKLVDGGSWKEALAATALQWGQIAILSRADPDGFGMLLQAAEGAKDAVFRRVARDALRERAVEGWDEPVFGGIGQGLTGEVGKKRKFSDRLLEFGLAKIDKPTFGDSREAAAGTNIGQQIVYNITGVQIGDVSAKRRRPESKIDDSVGDNPATIDIEDVDI